MGRPSRRPSRGSRRRTRRRRGRAGRPSRNRSWRTTLRIGSAERFGGAIHEALHIAGFSPRCPGVAAPDRVRTAPGQCFWVVPDPAQQVRRPSTRAPPATRSSRRGTRRSPPPSRPSAAGYGSIDPPHDWSVALDATGGAWERPGARASRPRTGTAPSRRSPSSARPTRRAASTLQARAGAGVGDLKLLSQACPPCVVGMIAPVARAPSRGRRFAARCGRVPPGPGAPCEPSPGMAQRRPSAATVPRRARTRNER